MNCSSYFSFCLPRWSKTKAIFGQPRLCCAIKRQCGRKTKSWYQKAAAPFPKALTTSTPNNNAPSEQKQNSPKSSKQGKSSNTTSSNSNNTTASAPRFLKSLWNLVRDNSSNMFFKLGFQTRSKVELLLEKDDVSLDELLNEDDVVQESKAHNSKLIDLLVLFFFYKIIFENQLCIF